MIDLDELSYDELLTLNDNVVDRLNKLDALRSMQAMVTLNIGTQVSFASRRGREVGRVVKLNTKTIRVVTEDGKSWKVPAELVSKVEKTSDPNVIKISGKKKGRRRK